MDLSLLNHESLTQDSNKFHAILFANNILTSCGFLIDIKNFSISNQKQVRIMYKNNSLGFIKKFYKNDNKVIFQFESDLQLDQLGFLIYFKKSAFECIHCKKYFNVSDLHDKCCELVHSPIQLVNPSLDRIEIYSKITPLMNYQPKEEYVYVLSNPSFNENLLKIGFTRKNPIERAEELCTSGLPTPFVVESTQMKIP